VASHPNRYRLLRHSLYVTQSLCVVCVVCLRLTVLFLVLAAESGCVSLVGSYLSLKDITVYYLSTAQHDFVLVRLAQHALALTHAQACNHGGLRFMLCAFARSQRSTLKQRSSG
jgi:hypothetical protein